MSPHLQLVQQNQLSFPGLSRLLGQNEIPQCTKEKQTFNNNSDLAYPNDGRADKETMLSFVNCPTCDEGLMR